MTQTFEDKIQEFAKARMFLNKIELEKNNLEYRKNKGLPDVEHALKKAGQLKNGMGKVEYELSMFEMYLKKILKEVKQ